MRHQIGQRVALILLVALFPIRVLGGGAQEVTTSALLQQAIRATAARELDQARALYQQIMESDPQNGFPLYARFLSRTGQTTQLQELLASPAFAEAAPMVQVRTLRTIGETTPARQLLRAESQRPRDYATAVALYHLWKESGDTTLAQEVLLRAHESAHLSNRERIDLTNRLLRLAPSEVLSTLVPKLMAPLVENNSLDFPELRLLANEALAALDGRPGFAQLRAKVAAESTSSPLSAWLHALILQRQGKVELARVVLSHGLSLDPLTTAGRAVLVEELAQLPGTDLAEAERLYRELIGITQNSDRVRLKLAGILFRAKRYADVCTVIGSINRQRLSDEDQRLAANMRLTALAKVAPAEQVVAAFEEEGRGKSYVYLRELAEAPFALLPETEDHLKYRHALQARLKESTAPIELLVLMMSTENQLRSQEAIIAALENYVQECPTEYEALNEYAIAASRHAYVLAVGPHETTPSLETIRGAVDKAARALWQVIRTRPYATEPYLRLTELYRAVGDREKSVGVARSLAEHRNATAEDVHLAAYLLDEAGYTTESLELYRRAIEKDPASGLFKMNLANAYRKIGRKEDAFAIYRELFERGSHGRQHHVHQLTEDAWTVAEELQKTRELVQFWRSLVQRPDVPQRDELLLHIVDLLANKTRFADSLEFADLAQRQFPDTREKLEPIVAKAYAAQGDVERAREIYQARAVRASDDAQRIDEWMSFGKLLAGLGNHEEAVAAWEKLANQYPHHPQAARALLFAAQAEVARGRRQRAIELIQNYLSRDRGDTDAEREARELLSALSQPAPDGAAAPPGSKP